MGDTISEVIHQEEAMGVWEISGAMEILAGTGETQVMDMKAEVKIE